MSSGRGRGRPPHPDLLTPAEWQVLDQVRHGFRRADIALYESIKRRLLDQGATLLHLTTSFRSVPQIQSAVNEVRRADRAAGEEQGVGSR